MQYWFWPGGGRLSVCVLQNIFMDGNAKIVSVERGLNATSISNTLFLTEKWTLWRYNWSWLLDSRLSRSGFTSGKRMERDNYFQRITLNRWSQVQPTLFKVIEAHACYSRSKRTIISPSVQFGRYCWRSWCNAVIIGKYELEIQSLIYQYHWL